MADRFRRLLAGGHEPAELAEWVTDGPTADIVQELGITYLQGFHFGKPFEIEELTEQAARFAAAG